jgi:hypothetical protein
MGNSKWARDARFFPFTIHTFKQRPPFDKLRTSIGGQLKCLCLCRFNF